MSAGGGAALRVLRLGGLRPLAWSSLLGAAALASGVGLLAASGWLIARASQHPNEQALAVGVVAVRALGIARGLARYAERLATHDAAFRLMGQLRSAVFARLERLAPTGLESLRQGDLLSRFVSDVDSVQDLVVRGCVPAVGALLVGAGTAAVVALLAPSAAAALAVGLLCAGVGLPWWSHRMAASAASRAARTRAILADGVTDLLSGATELSVHGAMSSRVDELARTDDELARIGRAGALRLGAAQGLGVLVSGVTVSVVVELGLHAVRIGSLSPVMLVLVVLTALAVFEVVAPLPAAADAVAASRASSRRVLEVISREDPVRDPARPRALPPGTALRASGLGVRYPGTDRWALRGVDLELTPGRRVAVVGPSGSGKSTLIAALLRLVEISEGCLTLDAVDVRTLAGDDVRRAISGVTADPHIFDGTLRDNVRLARPDATDADLTHALARAGLLQFTSTLPHGADTDIGPCGVGLSGGERQRLALARALLADPAVLLLDEPAAHLDPSVRRELIRDLLTATVGRSTLMVTHDLAGLEQVDEIVVLDAGVVVERGRHEALSASGGRYAQLLDATRLVADLCERPSGRR